MSKFVSGGNESRFVHLTDTCEKFIEFDLNSTHWLNELVTATLINRFPCDYLCSARRIDINCYIKLVNNGIKNNKKYIIFNYPKLDKIADKHKFSGSEIIRAIYDLSCALIHMKKINMLHKDIKIDNIAFHEGRFMLFDYSHSSVTSVNKSLITKIICPPETKESKIYNYKSEIFSLGVSILEMYLRELPSIIKNIDYETIFTNNFIDLVKSLFIKYAPFIDHGKFIESLILKMVCKIDERVTAEDLQKLTIKYMQENKIQFNHEVNYNDNKSSYNDIKIIIPDEVKASVIKIITIYYIIIEEELPPIGAVIELCFELLENNIYEKFENEDIAAIIYFVNNILYDDVSNFSNQISKIDEYTVDERMLKQALINFIRNTSDFMNKNNKYYEVDIDKVSAWDKKMEKVIKNCRDTLILKNIEKLTEESDIPSDAETVILDSD